MAVGNVVMNRVKHPSFPSTIEGVLAQKNQFTTYWSGHIGRSSPNAESVIAAKLVLDGGVVEEVKNALYFDSAASSWPLEIGPVWPSSAGIGSTPDREPFRRYKARREKLLKFTDCGF